MSRRFVSVARLCALAGSVALVLVVAASAANVQLRGTQTTVDADLGISAMRGDLVGDWYTTGVDWFRVHPSGTVQAAGSELFVGCLNSNGNATCDVGEPSGWIAFDFRYSASAVGPGRCHHPIVDSGGDFTGTTGELTFKDRLGECGEVITTYSGHIGF